MGASRLSSGVTSAGDQPLPRSSRPALCRIVLYARLAAHGHQAGQPVTEHAAVRPIRGTARPTAVGAIPAEPSALVGVRRPASSLRSRVHCPETQSHLRARQQRQRVPLLRIVPAIPPMEHRLPRTRNPRPRRRWLITAVCVYTAGSSTTARPLCAPARAAGSMAADRGCSPLQNSGGSRFGFAHWSAVPVLPWRGPLRRPTPALSGFLGSRGSVTLA